MARGSTRFSPPEVIDLTQNDDEDDSQNQWRILSKQPSPQTAAFVSSDKLARFKPETRRRDQVYRGRQDPILPWHARDAQAAASRQIGLFKTNANSSTQYRKSTGQTSASNAAPASNSAPKGITDSLNPAKRRKTHGGPVPPQITPILPPALRYTKPEIPLQTIQQAHRVQPPPATKTIISGTIRAESSRTPRLSPEGRIQKPQRTVATGNYNPKSEECPANQVLKQVKGSLGRYRDALPQDIRTSIGAKTAEELLDYTFFKDFNSNGGKLSKEYENNLANRARAYVDRFAAESLNGIRANSRTPSKGANSKHTASSSSPTPRHWPSQSLFSSIGSDVSSSDEDRIFEIHRTSTQLPSVPLFDGSSHTYSSSPTTSFSNDHTDSEKPGDSNGSSSKSKIGGRTQQLRRSGRATTTTLLKPPKPPLPPQIEQIPKPKSRQDGDVGFRQTDIDAAREVQFLHLAARHTAAARPYLSYTDREDIQRGLESSGSYLSRHLSQKERQLMELPILHVDFCLEEIKILCVVIMNARGDRVSRVALDSDLPRKVMSLMAGRRSIIPKIQRDLKIAISQPSDDKGILLLQNRGDDAVTTFLQDAAAGKIAAVSQVVRLETKPKARTAPPKSRISSLLMQREVWGMTPYRICSGQESFRAKVTSHLEDSIVRQSEWTDCCGDISAITWTSKTAFVCGATAHSDFHNMQYNKPGNLVVGSSSLDTLRAVSNHRVIRPIVAQAENADNSLESMRQTQDPWLYTSVVSTAHSNKSGFTFTASFDATVKVWAVSKDGSNMDLRGDWCHEGKVNFVVTSEHHDRVATASDVSIDAVRVYSVDEEDIQGSAYDTYCGNKAQEQSVEMRETWAYFPATIQWGKAYVVSHLLLVGYSPRSLTSHEVDIPEEKRNTGELCLWNIDDGSRVNISSARTQNVFEVIWHPTQPIFLAATSPCGAFEPQQTKTQIRLFAQNELGTFLHIKALDCPAFDINELTIMPNSAIQCYVTASCTDGNTYVYDTAQGDQAIHILQHGESLDNPIHDLPREMADTGVKFAAWGQSKNRFYTGASDGKVKAWDVTAPPRQAFVRDVLVLSGGISAGAFSKDCSQLVVGDATGKVHLLSINDSDLEERPAQPAQPINPIQHRHSLQRGGLLPSNIKRPKVLIPHPEPPPPIGFDLGADVEQTGKELAQTYVEEGMIKLHEDPAIGAVQGVNYHETGLFLTEAHENRDGTAPLLPSWQSKQQFEIQRQKIETRIPTLPRIKSSHPATHKKNMSLDLDISKLSLSTQEELRRDRVDFKWDNTYNFNNELFPGKPFEIYQEDKESRRERKKWEKSMKMDIQIANHSC